MTELPPITAVDGWPAGASDFPSQVDSWETQTDGTFAKQINDITAAIHAIETTLGVTPGGNYATVKAALTNLNASLALLQGAQTNLAGQVASLSAVPGPPNSFFRFLQSSPQAVWSISHPLGRRPAVTVVDSAGSVVEGEVDYPSDSVVTVTFSSAFAGEALLS